MALTIAFIVLGILLSGVTGSLLTRDYYLNKIEQIHFSYQEEKIRNSPVLEVVVKKYDPWAPPGQHRGPNVTDR